MSEQKNNSSEKENLEQSLAQVNESLDEFQGELSQIDGQASENKASVKDARKASKGARKAERELLKNVRKAEKAQRKKKKQLLKSKRDALKKQRRIEAELKKKASAEEKARLKEEKARERDERRSRSVSESNKEKEAPDQKKGPRFSTKLIVLLGIAAVVLIASAIGVSLYLNDREVEPELVPHYFSLEKGTYNLKGYSYAVLKLTIEYQSEEESSLLGENLPMIKNEIISLVGDLERADIDSSSEKEVLKNQMIIRINELLDLENFVTNVYFEEFIVQ